MLDWSKTGFENRKNLLAKERLHIRGGVWIISKISSSKSGTFTVEDLKEEEDDEKIKKKLSDFLLHSNQSFQNNSFQKHFSLQLKKNLFKEDEKTKRKLSVLFLDNSNCCQLQ